MEQVLRDLLSAADHEAVKNVRSGRGGPFAASLHIYDRAKGAMIEVAPPAGNAVLETGLASAHAEDRVIAPANIRALKKALRDTGPEAAELYLVSSAESCPACHAKLEILARILMHEGLLQPGRFTVVYGASYDDTRDVAGFHDAPYHHDMTKPEEQRLIRVERGVPPAGIAPGQAAVVMPDGTAFTADDDREDDVIATAEIGAIRAACAAGKKAGAETPWDLGGAVLYAPVDVVGPLMYAESQWANIGRIFLTGETGRSEAPGIGNAELFSTIAARPYNHETSALRIIRLQPFANLAQHEWARLHREEPSRIKVYNGKAV
ncbi:MAG: hypothetical protein ACXW4B_09180 [Micavibrio sp.]